jgi:hypothetical protein
MCADGVELSGEAIGRLVYVGGALVAKKLRDHEERFRLPHLSLAPHSAFISLSDKFDGFLAACTSKGPDAYA